MKGKMIVTFISISLFSLIIAISASANVHFGTIRDKPASVTFIAFLTDDDDILTEKNIGSIYNPSTGIWGFEDRNFWTPPDIGEIGYIWLYGSNGICYTDSDIATGLPVNWGESQPSGSNIGAPENLTATQDPPGTVTLKWTAASGAKKYTIYRSVTSNGLYEIRVAEEITETTYVDAGLEYQDYYYIVVGKDLSGKFGGHSNEAKTDASVVKNKLTVSWSKLKQSH